MVVTMEAEMQLTMPKSEELEVFWQTFSADPIRYGAYLDTLATTLPDFLAPVERGEMEFWGLFVDGELAGASWIHDIKPFDGVRSGWMASYYFPDYRGVLGRNGIRLAIQTAADAGIPHLFTGTVQSNRVAQRCAIGSGYHLLGYVEDFGYFGGKLDTLALFTLKLEDEGEAWSQAEERARYNRLHPPLLLTVEGAVC